MRTGLRRRDEATTTGEPLPHPVAPVTTGTAGATSVLPVDDRRRNRTWWWVAVALALAVTAAVVALGRADDDDAQLGPAGTTLVPADTGTPAPAPTTTAAVIAVVPTVLPTVASVPATLPPTEPPVELAAADVDELLVLVREQPETFGDHADDLGDDLGRIAERRGSGGNGARIDRLLERVDEWTADGTLAEEPADLIRAVLTDLAAESADGGNGDDDD